METRFVSFLEIPLIVEGIYYKGSFGSHDTPPEEQEFEVHNVYISDTNITDLLTEEMIETLSILALEK